MTVPDSPDVFIWTEDNVPILQTWEKSYQINLCMVTSARLRKKDHQRKKKKWKLMNMTEIYSTANLHENLIWPTL